MYEANKNMPYYSQSDNIYEPYASCNVTCLAMALATLGVKFPNYMQPEDYLHQRAVNNGWDKFSVAGLKQLAESFKGIKDTVLLTGSLEDIRKSLSFNRPVIVHGYFTAPGHIIVIKDCTYEGFIVNDPYGEIMGLDHYDTSKSGENLHYSNGLIAAACDSWCHGQAQARYPMSKAEADKCKSIWMHELKRKDYY